MLVLEPGGGGLKRMLGAALGLGVPGGEADVKLVAVFGRGDRGGEVAPSRQNEPTLEFVARRRREHDER